MPAKGLLSVREAALVMGVAPATVYRAIEKDTFPSPVVRVGARILVPTAPLLEVLHLDEPPEAA